MCSSAAVGVAAKAHNAASSHINVSAFFPTLVLSCEKCASLAVEKFLRVGAFRENNHSLSSWKTISRRARVGGGELPLRVPAAASRSCALLGSCALSRWVSIFILLILLIPAQDESVTLGENANKNLLSVSSSSFLFYHLPSNKEKDVSLFVRKCVLKKSAKNKIR